MTTKQLKCSNEECQTDTPQFYLGVHFNPDRSISIDTTNFAPECFNCLYCDEPAEGVDKYQTKDLDALRSGLDQLESTLDEWEEENDMCKEEGQEPIHNLEMVEERKRVCDIMRALIQQK